ncbi:MAG TPA: hypothetical protein PKL97_03680 [Candidatus Omnitrophota bacterium]|nr:hypothetical protein [Candidatus Omnitrophota bacterium]
MAEWLRLALAGVPLFAIPAVIGAAFFGREVYWASRWWFGMTLAGILLILAHGFNLHGILVTILFSVFFVFCAIKSFRRLMPGREESAGIFPERVSPEMIGTGIIFFLLFCSYLDVLANPLTAVHWDALATWWNKTRALYFWPPFAETPVAGWDFLNYPYLGPMLELLIIRCTGVLSESFGRLLFPTVYFLWILAFNSLFFGKVRWKTVWLIPFTAVLFYDRRAFTSGYQDGFVGVICGMAALHFIRFFLRQDWPRNDDDGWDTDLFLGVFFSGAASFVKCEGLFLGIILAASAFLTFLFAGKNGGLLGKIRRLLPYGVFFGILICVWPGILLWNHANVLRMQTAFVASDIFRFHENLARWGIIRLFVSDSLLRNGPVILASVILSCASAVAVPRTRRILAFLWIALAGHGVFVTFLYFVTHLNLQWHLANSFGRLMFQHFFICAAIIYVSTERLINRLSDDSRIFRDGRGD